jgi:hypothetical protein
MNNLAARHADKASELSAKYDAWAKRANVVDWAKVPKG